MQQQENILLKTYGEEYVAEGTKTKSADKKIQDAHEAIRPTDITRTPAAMKDSSKQRSVPSVSADLETFHSQPHAAGRSMRQLQSRLQQESTVLLLQHPELHLMDFALCM